MNVLALPRLKNYNFKILPFQGPGGGVQTGAPNQNISIDMKSGQQHQYTVKFGRSYVEKQQFHNFDLSGGVGYLQNQKQLLYQGPKSNILAKFEGPSPNNKKVIFFLLFFYFFL